MRPAEYWGGGSPVQRFLRGSEWAFVRSMREAGRLSDVRFLHHLGFWGRHRIAGHESTRTTQFYNRLREEISLDEIERIHI